MKRVIGREASPAPLQYRVADITAVDEERRVAHIQDQFGARFEVALRFERSRRPVVGESWVLDYSFGFPTLLCPVDSDVPPIAIDRHLVDFDTEGTVSQVASDIFLVSLIDVPLSSDRAYRMVGQTRVRAVNSADQLGLVESRILVGDTVVARDRTMLANSTSTSATNFLYPEAGRYVPSETGDYLVRLAGTTASGVSNAVDWRGGSGPGFNHWLGVYDVGPVS